LPALTLISSNAARTEYRDLAPYLWEYPDTGRIERLVDALEYSDREDDNIFYVIERLATGNAQGVEIVQDGEAVGLSVVEPLQQKSGCWLNVWLLAGEGMDSWLDGYLAWLEGMVKQCGMVGVMCGGRVGWRRELGKRGWQEQAVIMRKRV